MMEEKKIIVDSVDNVDLFNEPVEQEPTELPRYRGILCRQCNRRHVLLPINHGLDNEDLLEFIKETTEIRGEKRYVNVCQKCARRYMRKDYRWAIGEINQSDAIEKARKAGGDDDIVLA